MNDFVYHVITEKPARAPLRFYLLAARQWCRARIIDMILAGDGQMSLIKFSRSASRSSALLRSLVLFLGLLLALEPLVVLTISAQGRQARRNISGTAQGLTEDQRIAHVLARLSFGARPGDFERVKAMGVNAY